MVISRLMVLISTFQEIFEHDTLTVKSEIQEATKQWLFDLDKISS